MYFCSETIYVFALRASLRWCKCVCMCICASAVVSRCLCLCVSHFAFCVAIYPYYSMHTECIKEIFGEMTIFQPASTHYTHLHSHKSARAFIVISYICIYGFWIHLFTLVIGHSDDDTMICNNNNSNERKKMRLLFLCIARSVYKRRVHNGWKRGFVGMYSVRFADAVWDPKWHYIKCCRCRCRVWLKALVCTSSYQYTYLCLRDTRMERRRHQYIPLHG